MGDADDTYDFSNLSPFLQQLREGADLVMGNRFRGGIEPGAMPLLHRYLGNPGLSWLARFLFRASCGDVYCGLRGLTKSACQRLGLQSVGMEYALEMVAKASVLGMKVAEVPTRLSRDRRNRVSHLRTWRDGRRSIRTYMLFSPNWLFLYPGVFMMLAGLALGVLDSRHAGGDRGSALQRALAAVRVHDDPAGIPGRLFWPVHESDRRIGGLLARRSAARTAGRPFTARSWSRRRIGPRGWVSARRIRAAREQRRFGDLSVRVMRLASCRAGPCAGMQTALASLFLSLLKVQFLETGLLGPAAVGALPGHVPRPPTGSSDPPSEAPPASQGA